MSQQPPPVVRAKKKTWARPELRKIGTIQELVRTQEFGEQRVDHLAQPGYFVS